MLQTDFESSVPKNLLAREAADHAWARPRKISIAEMIDAAKLPHEFISPPKEKPKSEQRLVTVFPRARLVLTSEVFRKQVPARAHRAGVKSAAIAEIKPKA